MLFIVFYDKAYIIAPAHLGLYAKKRKHIIQNGPASVVLLNPGYSAELWIY